MKDERKTKKRLIEELNDLRLRLKNTEERFKDAEENVDEVAKPFMSTIHEDRTVISSGSCDFAKGKQEEEFRNNEAKYRSLYQEFHGLLNGIPDIVSLFSPDLTIIWENEMSANAFGKKDSSLQYCYQLRHGFTKPCEFCPVLRSFQSGKQEAAEVSTPDGRLWDLRAIPVLDEREKVKAVIELARNITERKQAEEALRTSEAILSSVFKAVPVGLCIMKNRVFQNVNKHYFKNLGYSESDTIGQTPRFLFENDEEYVRVGRELYTHLRERGLTSAETTHRKKNGDRCEVVLTAVPLQSTDIHLGLDIVVVEDITERKRAVASLEENRKQLANIIEFLPDATLVVDRDGKVIAWNRAMEDLSGVKAEEMLGKGNNEYAIPFYGETRRILVDFALHPDIETESKYPGLQRTGDSIFGEDYTPLKGLKDINLSGHASILRDSKGEITGAIECIRNITERKHLEERLQRAEKMESLGILAGGVAHDLNNMLGVMSGYAELMMMEIAEDDPLHGHIKNIVKSSERAATIVQDMLTLARRGVVTKLATNLNAIITDQIKTPEYLKLSSFYSQISVKTNLEPNLLNINGSPVHIGKTLMNLISNAAEAIRGEGTVTIRTENRYLDRSVSGYDQVNVGDYVVLSVSDTGEGISPADIRRIFEPFYTKKVMGKSGTGLGLSVVWGTVKDHDGYVDVKSAPGEGTIFTLYFPVTRDVAAEHICAMPKEYMGKGEAILVVDDVGEQRELAAKMLSKLSYNVSTVAGGEEAVEYLKGHDVDLVVLDMIMDPGIDGLETYRRIIETKPGQRAVIVSGFAETERVKQSQNLGAGLFIKKPYMLESIGMAVRRELDRK